MAQARTRKKEAAVELPPDDHPAFHHYLCAGCGPEAAQPSEPARVHFAIDRFQYALAQSAKPDRRQRVIRVFGCFEGKEWSAYLCFGSDPKPPPPMLSGERRTLYVFYPETYFATIDALLRGPEKAFCSFDRRFLPHVWASIEAAGS